MKPIRECTTEEVCQMLRKVKYVTGEMKLHTEGLSVGDVLDEAIRRLDIKPKVPFNDEQFNV